MTRLTWLPWALTMTLAAGLSAHARAEGDTATAMTSSVVAVTCALVLALGRDRS